MRFKKYRRFYRSRMRSLGVSRSARRRAIRYARRHKSYRVF